MRYVRPFALLVSIIFHFITVAPLTYLVIISKYPLPERYTFKYPFVIFVLDIVAPLLFLYINIRRKQITDLDVTVREQREPLLIEASLGYFLATVVSLALPIPEIYKVNAVFSLVFLIAFATVTYYWKISFHMGVLGWFAGIWFSILGFQPGLMVAVAIMVLLTGWSRIYLKRHTFGQVVAGFLVSFSLFEIVYLVFG